MKEFKSTELSIVSAPAFDYLEKMVFLEKVCVMCVILKKLSYKINK